MLHARTARRALSAISLALVLTHTADGGPEQIIVREQLGQTRRAELLAYPVSAPDKTLVDDAPRVEGPDGTQPAQLADIEYWPGDGRFVKAAQLYFICEGLTPRTSKVYTVTSGPQAATAPRTDLAITVTKPGKTAAGQVEIATTRLGVRLPLGQQEYADPVPLTEIPAPLAGIRFGDGPWSAGSRWQGDARVKQWSARLVDRGPVFARVLFLCSLADGTDVMFTATVAAGDNTVRWDMDVTGDRPELVLDLVLPPLPGVAKAILPKGYGQWAKDRSKALQPSDEPFAYLSPDTSIANIMADYPPCIRLVAPDSRELQLRSRDPGVWVDPVPMTYGGEPTWTLEGVGRYMTYTWRAKAVPVSYAADGTTVLRATLAQGQRKWRMSDGEPVVGEQLHQVNQMVLDWPQTTHHPRIYMSRAEVDETLERLAGDEAMTEGKRRSPPGGAARAHLLGESKADAAQKAKLVSQLKQWLSQLGEYDVFRQATHVITLYDAIIDTDLVTPQERSLMRAQMAYLGYVLADPKCWSMERGYLSGNPNMSVSYTLSIGIWACMLPDHPMAPQWSEYCNRWLDKWLSDEVGEGGQWLPEGMSYGGQVSLPPILAYAIAAKRAGYGDFTTDPRLRKLVLYFAKQYVPNDHRRDGMRVSPPVGRAHAWQTGGYLGLAAKMLSEPHPETSRALQWLWIEGQCSTTVGDHRLGDFAELYLDRTLPAEAPKWGTCFFPQLGAVMRDGFNTPGEHYLNILSHVDSDRNLDIWTPDVGIVAAWFAYGKPVSAGFNIDGSYAARHELLSNGIRLARNYDGKEDGKSPFGYYTQPIRGPMVALPGADYVRGAYEVTKPDPRNWFPPDMPAWPKVNPATGATLTWTRQALFVRDRDVAGPHWLLLRDTTAGGQPTDWQFWTYSKVIGTPEQVADPDFAAEEPGRTIQPARELPAGTRYTALGQFGVDVEYFIAAPAEGKRHTLRYGGKSHILTEYEDLLHLHRDDDGAYCVAVYPRVHETPAPTFTSTDAGRIVCATGEFGTDYAFLSDGPATAGKGDVRFSGTAGAVQVRPDYTELSLAGAGGVQWKAFALSSEHAAGLTVKKDLLTLRAPADHAGTALTLTAPADWQLERPATGVEMIVRAGGYDLTFPRGVTEVTLARRP